MKEFPIITDIYGISEPLYDWKGLKRIREVNGERSVSFSVLNTEKNKHAYDLIRDESTVTYKGIEYRIKLLKERSSGAKSIKTVKALHQFFDLVDHYIYDIVSGPKQLDELLTMIFAGTPYTYVIIGSFSSVDFEDFGDDTALSLLQTIIQKYQVEFSIDGTFFTFKEKIGDTSDFQFRYKYNMKAVDINIDSSNLSTYIKGYGKDIEAEYISPYDQANGGPFRRKHAAPIRDEKYTTEAGLLVRLQQELRDEPDVSITVDFAYLRAAGYAYDVPGDGDTVYLIHEPMKLDVNTRIMRIEEDEDNDGNVIRCLVTLSNYRKNAADVLASLGNTQKQVRGIIEGTTKLPYSVLDSAVQRATEALQSAQTQVEFNNGFILRSELNHNYLVLINSSGIGVSLDGGQTFQTAMTAEGFVADLITIGTMLADRIKGGTLTLGGLDNGNGRMQVLNADGEVIADLDADRGGFSDLYVANLESPTVVQTGIELNTNYYVAEKEDTAAGVGQPDDSNDGLSWATPLRTIGEAIRRLPRYIIGGTATIYLAYGHKFNEEVFVRGFMGGGALRIDGQSRTTTIIGRLRGFHNGCRFDVKNMTVNGTNSYGCVEFAYSMGACTNVVANGLANNGTEFGIDVRDGAYYAVGDCEVYSVQRGISARYGATAYATNNKGYGSVCGHHANGGYIVGSGTQPGGAQAPTQLLWGGQQFPSYTVDTGTYVVPAPPETTTTWDAQSTDSWHEGASVWDNTTNDPLQGKYGSAGRYRGCWFFGSSPSTAVTGKTIKQIRVYLQRTNNSGSGVSQTAVIRPHGYTSKPAGAPGYLAASHSVGFKWNEAKWVTLPTSFHSLFANGSAKGIMIYTTDDSQYMRFMQAAKIEITYS